MKHRMMSAGMVILVAAALLAGCGGGDTAAPAVTSGSAFNEADATFAQGMIPHHEQAIEMADIALDPVVGASAEVKSLATRIKNAQDPEIVQMTAWLKAWNKPTTMDHADHDMSAMPGMMSANDMSDLETLRGREFDAAFYRMMIRHHEGAITMAKQVQADGTSPEVKTLAGAVISAQAAEIAEMRKALG